MTRVNVDVSRCSRQSKSSVNRRRETNNFVCVYVHAVSERVNSCSETLGYVCVGERESDRSGDRF